MEKKYHYCYVTTNIVNNKKYVGDHSTNNLDDGYLGSGNIFTHSVIKYGKENFKKEILEFFDTKQEAFDAQVNYINEYNSLIPSGYNISPTGGHNVGGCFSEETIEKLRIGSKYKKSKEQREKIRNGVKLAIKEKRLTVPSWEGRTHSNESKEKMSNSQKGKIMSKESKEKNRMSHKKENLAISTRSKMSESAKKRWENYRKNKN